MTYNLRKLEKMGAEYEQLTSRLKELRAALRAEVIAAHTAGVPQIQIVKASRYTREAVRTMTQGSDGPTE